MRILAMVNLLQLGLALGSQLLALATHKLVGHRASANRQLPNILLEPVSTKSRFAKFALIEICMCNLELSQSLAFARNSSSKCCLVDAAATGQKPGKALAAT